ncbi:CDP-alcohol phosphatidyltransferase family protein [Patescibacteria group bacterium]|nr:MAG: CDP-alcohol phosphatidyltransferase family protein [Patescibacteria group bacterium]
MPDPSQFTGDKKVGQNSLFSAPEKKFINWAAPKVPARIKSHHLTYSTIVWSLGIILFGYLAQDDLNWLWGASAMILLQWLTDVLDGAVGRRRNKGLVKWGYYMDHFLDYIFLCSVLIGYSFFLNDYLDNSLFFILAVFGGFMVNSYLSFAATGEFRITYLKIGPTEMRLVFIIVNTLLVIFGKTYMARALPYVLAFSAAGLWLVVYRTQKMIWKKDMEAKNPNAIESSGR